MKIICYLNSKEIGELLLEKGCEYLIGRDTDCDFVLEKLEKISRKQFKIVEEGGKWKVIKITDVGSLNHNGQSSFEFFLDHEDEFSSEKYKFIFKDDVVLEDSPKQPPSDSIEQSEISDLHTQSKTRVDLPISYEALIKIQEENSNEKIYKMKKSEIIIGRDPSCDIELSDVLISRYHIKIYKKDNSFFIEDLGSANKTTLNSKELAKSQLFPLESGDSIEILNTKMIFEIRQVSEHIIPPSNEIQENENNVLANTPPIIISSNTSEQAVVELNKKSKKSKAFILPVLAVAVVLGVLYIEFFTPKPKPKKIQPQKAITGNPQFDNLTEEEQALVKESLNFAIKFLSQNKFQSCIEKVKNIKQFVDEYENSEEIIKTCSIGYEKFLEQQNLLKRKQQEEELSNKISENIKDCNKKIKEFKTAEDAKTCLQITLDLEPENQKARSIITEIELQIEAELNKKRRKEQSRALKRHALGLYSKALKQFKNKKYKTAIKQFKYFLNKKYTFLKKQNKEARNKIKESRKILKSRITNKIKSCTDLVKKNDLEKAFFACQKALIAMPDNKEILESIDLIKTTIKKKVQSTYQRSVLEEELGNIDIAIGLWKDILKKSFKTENYYEKSKRQLEKYGVLVD